MAQIVQGNVHLTVNLTPVDTRMDGVLRVLKVGWVIIVPKVLLADQHFSKISHIIKYKIIKH